LTNLNKTIRYLSDDLGCLVHLNYQFSIVKTTYRFTN